MTVVIVAYPATPIVSGRARFCVSSSHTFSDISRILIACDDIGGMLGLKHGTKYSGKKRWTIKQVIERWREVIQDFDDD
jgi:serine palmitoyltransferase